MIFLLELNMFLWSLFVSGESSVNEMTQREDCKLMGSCR